MAPIPARSWTATLVSSMNLLSQIQEIRSPGNAPRYFPYLRTEGIKNLDFSIFKTFNIREGMYFQLRAEFFNFTNTPRFGLPGTSFGSGDFGLITYQANSSRHGQIGVRFVW